MFDVGEPASGPELVAALRRVTRQGAEVLGTMPVEVFFAPQGAKWSPADHARHLQLSAAPLVTALRLPRWFLRFRFGTPHRASRTFADLRADYAAALTAGGSAGRFAPPPEEPPPNGDWRRGEILTRWFLTNGRVGQLLTGWAEDRLDSAFLPHPLLGKLTVREMASFTVYHNLHHLTLIQERLAGGA